VELQDAAARRDYTARELDGKERETWWAPTAIPSAGALCVRDSPLDLHGAFEALTTGGNAAISPSPVCLTLDL
jgi:hypothetical protein